MNQLKPIKNKLKNLFYQNTVLERGLLVAPVVVMAYNLKNAVGLSVAFALITFFTVLITTFIPRRIPYTIRIIINVLIAALMFIPASMVVEHIESGLVYKLGIFLPLLITNSLIVQKSETRFKKIASKYHMIIDLLYHIIGFAIVACLVGSLREVIGSGMLWGNTVGSFQTAPAIALPFAGFMIIGLMSAYVNWRKNRSQKGANHE